MTISFKLSDLARFATAPPGQSNLMETAPSRCKTSQNLTFFRKIIGPLWANHGKSRWFWQTVFRNHGKPRCISANRLQPAPHKKTEVFSTSRRAVLNVGACQPDKTRHFFGNRSRRNPPDHSKQQRVPRRRASQDKYRRIPGGCNSDAPDHPLAQRGKPDRRPSPEPAREPYGSAWKNPPLLVPNIRHFLPARDAPALNFRVTCGRVSGHQFAGRSFQRPTRGRLISNSKHQYQNGNRP